MYQHFNDYLLNDYLLLIQIVLGGYVLEYLDDKLLLVYLYDELNIGYQPLLELVIILGITVLVHMIELQ